MNKQISKLIFIINIYYYLYQYESVLYCSFFLSFFMFYYLAFLIT